MVIIEELRITNDAQKFVIRARVRGEDNYKNVYIDKVLIDTQDTYSEGGSSTPVYEYQVDGNEKSISIVIDRLDLNPDEDLKFPALDRHLFFVYIYTKGAPTDETKCVDSEKYTLGVTMYMGLVYSTLMAYMKEMENNCCVPQNFIDLLLRWKAINVAIDSGHYVQGIKFYNKWFSDKQIVYNAPKCNCNG